MSVQMQELVRIFRSKNAGPLFVTIDLVFADETPFRRVSDYLTAARVAVAYGVGVERVKVIAYPPSTSIKVVLTRPAPAGSRLDTDLYGAQQHMPLMRMEVPDDFGATASVADSPAARPAQGGDRPWNR